MKKPVSYSLFTILLILLACNNPSQDKKTSSSSYDQAILEQGHNFAMQTQRVLATNLINAINTKGTVHAIAFCSEKVYPLTDSMAIALDARLKRVSDKPRNPGNKANKMEMAYISKSKELLANGEEIKPEMTEINGKMVGYYPIITNQICMQCHGSKNIEVLPETLSQIEKLYPDDQGIW